MNKFTIEELYELLVREDKFIYHGIAEGKGGGNPAALELSPVQRFANAISKNYGLCCSTIALEIASRILITGVPLD